MTQKELRERAEELLGERAKLLAKKQDLEEDFKRVNKELEKYRRESAERVIEFVAWNSAKLTEKEINTLLIHTLNKLNGNIDGIELDLEYYKKESK